MYNSNKKWSQAEDSLLKSNYGKIGKNKLLELISGRSWRSIKSRASTMKLTKEAIPDWTNEEIEILKENWYKSTKDEIIKLLPNRTYATINKMRWRLQIKTNKSLRNRTYNINDIFFDTPSVLNSYYAGWIATDANVHKNTVKIELQEKDIELLENFKRDCGYNGIIYMRKGGLRMILNKICNVQNSVKLVINCPFFVSSLNKNWNITPNKSLTYIGPKYNGYENDLAFLLGAIEGDGSIGIAKRKQNNKIHKYPYFMICSGSKQSLIFIQDFLNKHFNMNVSILETKYTYRNSMYRITKIGADCLPFLRALRDLPCPHLSRKWNNPDLIKFLNGEEVVPEDIDNAETDANIDTEEIIDKNNIIQNSTIISTTSHV